MLDFQTTLKLETIKFYVCAWIIFITDLFFDNLWHFVTVTKKMGV